MCSIKITSKYYSIDIELTLDGKAFLCEHNLSVFASENYCTLYHGYEYDKKNESELWNFIVSLYKEFLLYRKYKIKDDLYLENGLVKRYFRDLLVCIPFSEELTDNIIDEVHNICDTINDSPYFKYNYYFSV